MLHHSLVQALWQEDQHNDNQQCDEYDIRRCEDNDSIFHESYAAFSGASEKAVLIGTARTAVCRDISQNLALCKLGSGTTDEVFRRQYETLAAVALGHMLSTRQQELHVRDILRHIFASLLPSTSAFVQSQVPTHTSSFKQLISTYSSSLPCSPLFFQPAFIKYCSQLVRGSLQMDWASVSSFSSG